MQRDLNIPFRFSIDKRWREGSERWHRPPILFDPSSYGVDVVAEREARAFTIRHHYSRSFPAAICSVGLFRGVAAKSTELVGVAVFAVPMNERTIPRYTPFEPRAGAELSRLVILDEVAFNAETWFLKRAFVALRAAKPTIRAIVSYADPLERRDGFTGEISKRAHHGTIYQAHNAAFGGRASARYLTLAPNGTIISERTLSKIRNEERGIDYASRQLVDAGSPHREPHESPRQWVERALRTPGFRRVHHPGNFVYAFGLDRAAKDRVMSHLGPFVGYPRASAA